MTDHTEENPPNPESEEPHFESSATQEADTSPFEGNPTEVIQAFKEKATDAFKTGASEARESFEKTLPNLKEDLTKGIDDVSYAIGYAMSFGSTLVKEMSPDNVTDGFDKGTEAGKRAAQDVVDKRKAPSTEVPDDQDPATA